MSLTLQLDTRRNGSSNIRSCFIGRVKGLDAQLLQGDVLRTAKGRNRTVEPHGLIPHTHFNGEDDVLRRLEIRLTPTRRDVGVGENRVDQFAGYRILVPNSFPLDAGK